MNVIRSIWQAFTMGAFEMDGGWMVYHPLEDAWFWHPKNDPMTEIRK